jgi:hypothetical protein
MWLLEISLLQSLSCYTRISPSKWLIQCAHQMKRTENVVEKSFSDQECVKWLLVHNNNMCKENGKNDERLTTVQAVEL